MYNHPSPFGLKLFRETNIREYFVFKSGFYQICKEISKVMTLLNVQVEYSNFIEQFIFE